MLAFSRAFKASPLNDAILLILLAALWGSSFIVIKIAVHDIPPITVAAGRLIIAAMTMLFLLKLTGGSLPRDKKTWILASIIGVSANALPFSLINWGEQTIDGGMAAIFAATIPLNTALLTHYFTADEKISAPKLIGIICGFAGVLFLIGPEVLQGLGAEVLAQLAVFSATLCYAISTLITKKFPRHGLSTTTAILIMSVPFITPVAFIVEDPLTVSASNNALIAVLYLGLFPTALATLILVTLIGRRGANYLASNNYLVPVFGLFWGFLLLGEVPPITSIGALALILVGITLANSKRVQNHFSRQKPASTDMS